MAQYHRGPSCHREPVKSLLSCDFPQHKCTNGNACPICGTMEVSWNVEKAYSRS